MNLEQRANIKFGYELKKTADETHKMMQKVYGDEFYPAPLRFKRFKGDQEDFNDDKHSGRPRSVVGKEKVEIVREFIK